MNQQPASNQLNRRTLLGTAGAALAATAIAGNSNSANAAVKKGRINQSVVQWCFGEHWDVEKTIQVAKELGCGSVELISSKYFKMLKKYDMECAIGTIDMGDEPPFVKGFNNPKYKDKVFKATRDAIDSCAEYGFKNAICFTGMSEDLTDEEGADNCVKQFKEIIGYAEKKKVTLCLEMLNTRDDSHPMKGHPGYQGDGTEYCIDIIKRVGSPNLKLLFDIYHVQIMDGDVIRRIREHKDYLGHIHTAGNPGRGELVAEMQEINYPAVMRALLEVGYDGYVGQEFIPTGDPLKGLKDAVSLCDV